MNWSLLNTANSGLTADWVTDIAEDASGALWFATYGGGLCRLDPGGDWASFRAVGDGLLTDYVGLAHADAQGRVWAVCDTRAARGAEQPGGLCVLRPDGAWRTFPRGADEPCIRALETDLDGALWINASGLASGDAVTRCAGVREGPDRFHGGTWQCWRGDDRRDYEDARAAAAAWFPRRAAHGRLSWGASGDRIWLAEAIPPPPMPPIEGLGGSGSFAMSMLGSFLYEYALASYDGREWVKQAVAPSPFRWGEIVVDARGRVWASLILVGDIQMGAGVGCWDGLGWTVYNQHNGLASDYVGALSADSRGRVWAAHMLGDVSCWDGAAWTIHPGKQGGRGDQDLGRALEDRQGRLWFPSRGGAVMLQS
jgi:hypothetical protein